MNQLLEEFGITSTNEMTEEIAINRVQHLFESTIGIWDAWPLEDNCHYCVTCLSVV
jgi:hypothetical protein